MASVLLTALSVDERENEPGESDKFVLEVTVKPGDFSEAKEETRPGGKWTSRGHMSLL